MIRYPEPEIVLDVDLRNPGQFFACCGALELASQLWPGSEGWFARDGSRASFHVTTGGGHNDPLGAIVTAICEAEPLVRLADDHEAYKKEDRKPLVVVPFRMRLDWWLHPYGNDDSPIAKEAERKSPLKVWAGQQTPHGKFSDLRDEWRLIATQDEQRPSSSQLFRVRRPMKGRFGFDPSASWSAIDVGFSPDEQEIPVQTSPATEILAAIGLQRCRPVAAERRGRWFIYHPWHAPLEISVAPAGLAGAGCPLGAYEFPVLMRNAQYGSFGWARPLED
jgi:CRISPR-associated protein Csx14